MAILNEDSENLEAALDQFRRVIESLEKGTEAG
jgi:exonuclease VII small subunit